MPRAARERMCDWQTFGGVAFSFAMPTITVQLPDEDLAFLRAHAQAQGISAEDFLAKQTRNLRELLQKPLSPAVIAASGTINSEIDGIAAYREHLENKYR